MSASPNRAVPVIVGTAEPRSGPHPAVSGDSVTSLVADPGAVTVMRAERSGAAAASGVCGQYPAAAAATA
ncbi:hypothetical protein [Microbacterium elymi]|uniref:Uncharacterized protein n=1 Tax=Microbacterium elymi TaxID=2909587 RepID=A0ABY5NL21_9MICO|nr:hypothetical protein [Microbacterium elymi]UUT35852.1 hypothetical protein L2X98_22020 [Microbacterium elymi]